MIVGRAACGLLASPSSPLPQALYSFLTTNDIPYKTEEDIRQEQAELKRIFESRPPEEREEGEVWVQVPTPDVAIPAEHVSRGAGGSGAAEFVRRSGSIRLVALVPRALILRHPV